MTTEQINKAAEEYARQFPPHLQKFAEADYIRGANFAIQEIEELKAKHKEAFQNACDVYSDDVTDLRNQIEELKAENAKLREQNSVALRIIADNGLSSFLTK